LQLVNGKAKTFGNVVLCIALFYLVEFIGGSGRNKRVFYRFAYILIYLGKYPVLAPNLLYATLRLVVLVQVVFLYHADQQVGIFRVGGITALLQANGPSAVVVFIQLKQPVIILFL